VKTSRKLSKLAADPGRLFLKPTRQFSQLLLDRRTEMISFEQLQEILCDLEFTPTRIGLHLSSRGGSRCLRNHKQK
jgi:hypothetical protein